MVWQIGHNFDTEKGKVDLNVRFPFMEMQMFVDQEKIKKFPDLVREREIYRGIKRFSTLLKPDFTFM